MTKNSSDSKLTFEQAYKRLEEIASELENSDTPLEKSFDLFEEGQKLIRMCHQLLDRAEKRLKILTEVDGRFEVKEELFD
ncbi:exodeoxyribonuclease VII small subunit [bacterium]|nr:exodeoxyribonuclease VII small subunit [bacterium]